MPRSPATALSSSGSPYWKTIPVNAARMMVSSVTIAAAARNFPSTSSHTVMGLVIRSSWVPLAFSCVNRPIVRPGTTKSSTIHMICRNGAIRLSFRFICSRKSKA
jgi:hypothetical protein